MNKENLEKIFNEDLGTSFFPQLAEEYIKEGDYELAKKVCNVGLLLNPHNNDGKYILAKIMMVDGDGKDAESILKEILSEDTLYVNALRLLVMYYNSKSIKQVNISCSCSKLLSPMTLIIAMASLAPFPLLKPN